MPLPPGDRRYTYADYCTWNDSERWELINGIPYAMSPARSPTHQRVSGELFGQLRDYLKGKPCEVFHAPLDVRLNADDRDDTVVQPDLVVICDHSKIDEKGCTGAPDMIIEVLSPSTARHDRWMKYNLYKSARVQEYWMVDPDTKIVSVNVLTAGEYVGKAYSDTDTAPVTVLPGCTINLSDVFAG